jgi:hypothetical protein
MAEAERLPAVARPAQAGQDLEAPIAHAAE